MRRRVLTVFVLLSACLAVYACGGDTLAPTESGIVSSPGGSVATTSDGSGSETTDDFQLERGRAPKVPICHIPQGNPDNAQLINISGNAEQMHRTKHGDAAPGEAVPGMAGYDFDADCVPVLVSGVTCPCAITSTDLSDFVGSDLLLCEANFVHWQPANDAGRAEVTAADGGGNSASCYVSHFSGGGDGLFTDITDAQFPVCRQLLIDTALALGGVCL